MRCVITGAARGIGRALAHVFVAAGYDVVGIDRERGEAPFPMLLGDLGNPGDLDHFIEELGQGPPIDILIHNAGINCVGPFVDSDPEEQCRVMAINLRAPMRLTQSLSSHMAEGGSVVHIASLSHYVGYPGAAVYAASKDGLTAFAEAMSERLAERGIHTLTVFPGPTRTEHARRYSPDNSREHRRMPPERVASEVLRAVQRRRRILIPGRGNRLFALLGRWFPRWTERMLCKTILSKLK